MMSHIQYPNFFSRLFRWGITLSCFLILAAVPSSIQEYGIQSPTPIGPYLNGVFSETTPGGAGEWELVMAFPNLTFVDPIQMLELPGGNKFLMAGKKGKLWTFDNNYNTNSKQVFLDIENQVRTAGDAGLLGVAIHPEYGQAGSPNRGYIYVYYRYTLDQSREEAYLRLSRFTVPDGANQADRNSEFVLIQQYDRNDWHNGGGLFFGTDGFLYLTIGDEGGANDSYNVTQQINRYFYGGLLRIDVDQNPARSHPIRRQPQNTANPPSGWPNSFSRGYYIPDDNPWQDTNGSILEEFYALGLRSPHRATQDPVTGYVWVGDVGQASREEISVIQKKDNMQWPYKEGFLNGPKSKPNPLIGQDRDPVYDYGRSMGTCIIGGFVYRGSKWNALLGGKYIFGDHTVRNIWALEYNESSGTTDLQFMVNVPAGGIGDKSGISSFATDSEGNIYVLKLYGTNRDGGIIYKIQPKNYVPEAPTWLSQTGAFTNLENLTPSPGLIPYTVNSPLWSDGALKKRWIALPNDGTHNTAGEQISFSINSEWEFPEGTVFVKHFELPIDKNDPSKTKRLETRFIVRTTNGGIYGVTYKWNDDQTDARLLTAGDSQSYTITDTDGSQYQQRWDFPSRSDCITCHNANAGHILGVKTHQLNGDLLYEPTGLTDNQVRVWNHLGMFRPGISEDALANFPQAVPLDHPTATPADKVRSYLDANCAHCHRPNGVSANFDTRFTIPLANQQLINGSLRAIYDTQGAAVIKPGSLHQSILYRRDSSLGSDAMPPLAKNVMDEAYIEVLKSWINGMNPNDTCLTASTTYLTELPYRNTSDSSVVYTLDAQYDRFLAKVSPSENSCNSGSVLIKVLLDGAIADSIIYAVEDTSYLNISVSVFDAMEMQLVSELLGDSSNCVQIVWENARVEDCGGSKRDLWLEAECAEVGSDWIEVEDANASNGSYLVYNGNNQAYNNPPTTPESRIRFNVNVREAGQYRLFARIHAASTNDDSFWVRTNESNNWIQFNDIPAQNFSWEELHNTQEGNQITKLDLIAGNNTIDVAYRENGAWLDKLYISLEGEVSGNSIGENASNCTPPNSPPVAIVETTPTNGLAPLNIHFDASASFDHEGENLSFLWDFGDGIVAFGATTSHTYQQSGNWMVKLTIKDSQGAESIWEEQIQVNELTLCDSISSDTIAYVDTLYLSGNFDLLRASTDVSNLLCQGTMASFQIWIDGVLSYKSLPKSIGSTEDDILLDVAGANEVVFAITYNDQEISCHLGSWADIVLQNCEQVAVEDFWLEAECAEVGQMWTSVQSDLSSGGQYVVHEGDNSNYLPPPSESSYVRFRVNITSPGIYKLYARVLAPDNQHDSFWVRGGQPGGWIQFNDIVAPSFSWVQLHNSLKGGLPVELNLVQGENLIEFAYRESGTLLDKIYITKSGEIPNSMFGELATNCLDILNPEALDKRAANVWKVFPNPFTDEINVEIRSAQSQIRIEIIDSQGKIVYRSLEPSTNIQKRIKLDLASGVYLVRIDDGDRQEVFKILRQ